MKAFRNHHHRNLRLDNHHSGYSYHYDDDCNRPRYDGQQLRSDNHCHPYDSRQLYSESHYHRLVYHCYDSHKLSSESQ